MGMGGRLPLLTGVTSGLALGPLGLAVSFAFCALTGYIIGEGAENALS